MMENTDKQVAKILEAIQATTPETAEQAVAYWRFVDSLWLSIFIGIAMLAACFCCWFAYKRKTVKGDEKEKCEAIALISGVLACVALYPCACITCDLVKTHIATDYYAAECIVGLARSALGR